MISKTTVLRNRMLSNYISTRFQMAVVSDISEELILRRIESGKYEIVVIVNADEKFFRDQYGNRYTYAIGINLDGSIITS